MEENIIYEILENGENLIMIPSEPNLFVLELWEIIICTSVVFIVGLAIGLYISAQINLFIKREY